MTYVQKIIYVTFDIQTLSRFEFSQIFLYLSAWRRTSSFFLDYHSHYINLQQEGTARNGLFFLLCSKSEFRKEKEKIKSYYCTQ